MTFTISADDPRTIRAIEIAADADRWLRYGNRGGQEAFGVPSQGDRGHRYIVTVSSCDCPDFRRNEQLAEPRACKHILAVRLYCELVKAQERQPVSRRRGHLSLVPRTDEAGEAF